MDDFDIRDQAIQSFVRLIRQECPYRKLLLSIVISLRESRTVNVVFIMDHFAIVEEDYKDRFPLDMLNHNDRLFRQIIQTNERFAIRDHLDTKLFPR